jgi:hypothetical protein
VKRILLLLVVLAGSALPSVADCLGVTSGLCISTTSLPNAIVGLRYPAATLQTQNAFGTVNWSIVSGALPFGFVLFGQTPTLGTFCVGTPNPAGPPFCLPNTGVQAIPGTYNFTVQAFDSQEQLAMQAFTVIVANPVQITTQSLPNAVTGQPYNFQLQAAGGIGPYGWIILNGVQNLPPGFTFDQTKGVISSPAAGATGSFSPIIEVFDQNILTDTAEMPFTLVIAAPLQITTPSLPLAIQGVAYQATINASGGSPPYLWSFGGGNTQGLSINQNTGVISGVPATPGNFQLTVILQDTTKVPIQQIFGLQVVALLTITNQTLPDGIAGSAYSQTLAAGGGLLPYSWSVASGAPPGGFQLNGSTGVFAGTTNATGVFSVTFRVSDGSGQTASRQFTFTISLPAGPTTTIGLGGSTQPPVSVTLSGPFPLDINGTMTLTFASSVGGTDDMIRFVPSSANSPRTLNFLISAGTTTATFPAAPNAAVIPGTVAGTITLTVTALTAADGTNLLPNTPITKTIVTNPAVPVITSVTLQQVSGGIVVTVTGSTNTREVSSGLFHFIVSSGNTLSQADLTVQLASAYTAWFSTTPANAFGGEFKLTMPFSVTQGTGSAVTGVQVTLTNGQGPSLKVSSP